MYWDGPGFDDLYADLIRIYQNGIYTATYIDEHGCFSSSDTTISNAINFSSFLTGCYDGCEEDLDSSVLILTGIPGTFDYWEWRHRAPNSSTINVLDSGIGTIPNLTLDTAMAGKITLYVESDTCGVESGDFCLAVVQCPTCPELNADVVFTIYECAVGGGDLDETVFDILGYIQLPDSFEYCGHQPDFSPVGYLSDTMVYHPTTNQLHFFGTLHITDYDDFITNGLSGTILLCDTATGEKCPVDIFIEGKTCEDLECNATCDILYTGDKCPGVSPQIQLSFCYTVYFVEGDTCDMSSYTIKMESGSVSGSTFTADSTWAEETIYKTAPATYSGCLHFTMSPEEFYQEFGCFRLTISNNCGQQCEQFFFCTTTSSDAESMAPETVDVLETCDSLISSDHYYTVDVELSSRVEYDTYTATSQNGEISLQTVNDSTFTGTYITTVPDSGIDFLLTLRRGDTSVTEIDIEVCDPDTCYSGGRSGSAVQQYTETHSLKAFPNPGVYHVDIHYSIPDRLLGDDYRIVIRNGIGQVYRTFDVSSAQNSNFIQINTMNWSEGLYYITLERAGRIVEMEKLVVIWAYLEEILYYGKMIVDFYYDYLLIV